MTFSVKACSEAFIALSAVQGNPYILTYEVAIGISGGNVNELRHGVGGSVQATHSDTLLHCDETRHFWVSWTDGSVEFGKGQSVGSDKLLSWVHDTPYDVDAVSVSTQNSVEGTWEFTSIAGTS